MELKDNSVIVVLGASGDLAKKKTVSKPIPICGLYQANFFLVPGLVRTRKVYPSSGRRDRDELIYILQVPQPIPAQGHQDRWLC